MNRYIIGSLWDRVNRNGANKNFEYLFEGSNKIDVLNRKADGVLKEAKNTNDMNKDVQKQINTLIAESGTSDSEIVQARIDSEGNEYAILKERLDEKEQNFSTQLAQIATNVTSEFGVIGDYSPTLNTGSDDSVSLQNAFNSINDGTTLLVPKTNGHIAFGQHLSISNKHNFKIIFEGGKLYDLGKTITFSDGTTGKIPVGLSFENCSNFEIVGLEHHNENFSSKQVPIESIAERVPQIDYVNCKGFNVKKMSANGYVGGYIALSDSTSIEDMMRASYFRFVDCIDFEVDNPRIEEGSGGGEFLSFTRCTNYKLVKPTHYQGESTTTFWSMGKMIDVEHATVDNIQVNSSSTGSLFDVAGKEIHFINSHVDYPNGKFCDITNEWGVIGVGSDGVTFENCSSNGVSITTAGNYQFPIKNVKIDNFNNTGDRGVSLFAFENSTVLNTTFSNTQRVIVHDYSDMNYNFIKNVDLKNVNIFLKNSTVSTSIETHGKTIYDGGKINLNREFYLSLHDRWADKNNVTDLRTSKACFEIRNVDFTDTIIRLHSNVIFTNCSFVNCSFRWNSTSLQYQKTVFKNCDITFVSTNSIVTKASDYFSSMNNSPNHVEFIDTNITGEYADTSGTSLFDTLANSGSTVVFDGGSYTVRRNSNATIVPSTFFNLNESSNVTIKTKSADFNNVNLIMLSGGYTVSTSPISINVSNSFAYENMIVVNSTNTGDTNSKISFILTHNQIPTTRLTALEDVSLEFKKWVSVGNAKI